MTVVIVTEVTVTVVIVTVVTVTVVIVTVAKVTVVKKNSNCDNSKTETKHKIFM